MSGISEVKIKEIKGSSKEFPSVILLETKITAHGFEDLEIQSELYLDTPENRKLLEAHYGILKALSMGSES